MVDFDFRLGAWLLSGERFSPIVSTWMCAEVLLHNPSHKINQVLNLISVDEVMLGTLVAMYAEQQNL